MVEFLAYVHARPNAFKAADIFYVGKGSRKRMKALASNRNKHYKNIIAKHGANQICMGFFECSTEQNAFDLERGLIKTLRQNGVSLVNMTDGGEGVKGLRVSESHRLAMSAALKGRAAPNKGKPSPLKGRTLSEEHKLKLSRAKQGRKSPLFGTKLSVESKEKISKAQTGCRWINNGIVETKGMPEKIQYLLDAGFRYGRLSANRAQTERS